MSTPRFTTNKATVRVTMPDGCKVQWETRPDAPLSHNAKAFGKWLIEVGEIIIERSTTPGQCVAKKATHAK